MSIEQIVLNEPNLEEVMLKDHPIQIPDGAIKTKSSLKGRDVHLILTQDEDGISSDSMVIRSGAWGLFLLDAWFDPLYRSYGFENAETHALVTTPIETFLHC